MKKIIYRTLIPFIIGLSIFACLFLFNQLNQFALMANNLVKGGSIIAWVIFILIAFFIIYPIIQLLALPKPLKRPKAKTLDNDFSKIYNSELDYITKEDEFFYSKYKKRILKNFKSYVKNFNIDIELKDKLSNAVEVPDIQEKLKDIEKNIDVESNKIIKQYANTVFFFTAISQNAALDALLLLKIQIEMIWKIAHLYNQRPHWKEILNIYINVLANGLMAIGIADIPIDSVVERISTKIFKQSIWAKVPGIDIAAVVASTLADSIFEGVLNGLLTLRMGYIAKDYCKYSKKFDKVKTVKNASKKAVTQIRTLSLEESKLTKLIIKGLKKRKKENKNKE